MTKKKWIKTVQIVLIVLTVLFIFSNSMKSREASAADSGQVTEVVRPPVETVIGQGNLTDNMVRKCAHFAEFALLGLQMALLFRKFSTFSIFLPLLVALSDETIQILSERGSLVQDVWIDYAGALCGFFITLGIIFLVRRISSRKKQRHK